MSAPSSLAPTRTRQLSSAGQSSLAAQIEAEFRAAGHTDLSRPGRRKRALQDQWLRLAILGGAFQGTYWWLVFTDSRLLVTVVGAVVLGLCVAGTLMQVAHPSLHLGFDRPVRTDATPLACNQSGGPSSGTSCFSDRPVARR